MKPNSYNLLLNLWRMADFHAYLGYEFTHKRGIEGYPTRIIGVCFAHKRGNKSS